MITCPRCGAQNANTSPQCANCGEPFAALPYGAAQAPAQPQPYLQQPPPAQGGYPAPGPDYTKMGGWLLFFMIVCMLDALLGVIGAISLIRLGFAIMGWYGGYGVTLVIVSIIMLAAAALEVVFITQVFTRKPGFLRFYQICKIVVIGGTLIDLIATAVVAGVGTGSLSNIGSLIGGVVGIFLMTLYYSRSVRVRTYMGSEEYKSRALFAFKDPVPAGGYGAAQPYYQQPQAPQPPQQPAPYQAAPYQAAPPQATAFCATCGKPFEGAEAQCLRCGAPRA